MSRAATAPLATRISPTRLLSPPRCIVVARVKSAAVTFPDFSSSVPRRCGLLLIVAATTAPESKYTAPSLSRSCETTRSTPLFRLKSKSWKTSWIPISFSGPSIGISQPPLGAIRDVESPSHDSDRSGSRARTRGAHRSRVQGRAAFPRAGSARRSDKCRCAAAARAR